jgi:hypothetical protein
MGASLVPSSDDDDPEYRRKRAKREEKIQHRHQRQLSTLSIEQRDKAIRRMHSQIGLSRSDRALLKQTRGMSDEQIDRGLYFSVAPYQDLPAAIPLNFPGVHSSGKTLTNKYQGIACPLFNDKRQAIAADYVREKEQLCQTEHFLDGDRHKRRYAGDVTWNARKREARRFIGLQKFLDADTWHSPGDFKLLKLFCEHRQAMKERRENREDTEAGSPERSEAKEDEPFPPREMSVGETVSDDVPTTAENVYETSGGWNMTQFHTGQEIKGDLEREKMETISTTIRTRIIWFSSG